EETEKIKMKPGEHRCALVLQAGVAQAHIDGHAGDERAAVLAGLHFDLLRLLFAHPERRLVLLQGALRLRFGRAARSEREGERGRSDDPWVHGGLLSWG